METAVRGITIPAKPPEEQQACRQRLKHVAAYCRVSTDDKDQLSS